MKARSRNSSGAVLVFAVLLLAAGAFVLAGIAQLSATQALIGQNEWDALDRRIMLENSRSMARQFMLARMFNGVVNTNIGYTNAALGGFSLTPATDNTGNDYWTTLSTTNTNVNLKINPFTLMERGGFYRVVVPGTIYDGTNSVQWNFQVRTRSPITAGYPVVQHRPASQNIEEIVAPPYIDMNKAEKVEGFHEMARMMLSSVTNTNSSETTGYVGYLDVPIGVASAGLYTNQLTMRPNADFSELSAVLKLSAADPQDLNQVLRYVFDLDRADYSTNGYNYTNRPVTSLVLQGTETGAETYGLKPLQIIISSERTNLRTLFLEGRNPLVTGRPVYVNHERADDGSITITNTLNVVATNASGKWRIGITASRCNVSFNTAGIDIVGGVRTDSAISGNPSLEQDLEPGGLDYIADRMMWLEDYKTP